MVTKQGKFLHIDFGTNLRFLVAAPPGRPAHRQFRLD
jgi:hypothetical protein